MKEEKNEEGEEKISRRKSHPSKWQSTKKKKSVACKSFQHKERTGDGHGRSQRST